MLQHQSHSSTSTAGKPPSDGEACIYGVHLTALPGHPDTPPVPYVLCSWRRHRSNRWPHAQVPERSTHGTGTKALPPLAGKAFLCPRVVSLVWLCLTSAAEIDGSRYWCRVTHTQIASPQPCLAPHKCPASDLRLLAQGGIKGLG
ncbi:hypothetical protein TgHK011_006098 [Trichoderma gracile]|nr:hypothetical protein TgHK011_006098 [Trichoderma gracile]